MNKLSIISNTTNTTKMFPSSATCYIPNTCGGNSEVFSKGTRPFAFSISPTNIKNFFVSKFGASLFFAPTGGLVTKSIKNIVFPSIPAKIINSIIKFVVVKMARLHTHRTLADKSLKNKSMDIKSLFDFANPNPDNWSAFLRNRLVKYVGFVYNYTMSSKIRTDISKIRNFVSFSKLFPYFHNIDYTTSYRNLQGQPIWR